ncbi:MAG TPA: response regulator transcription factor [Candidatus Dormibacteraeota bacterium]|nr:response regulator transcription factor [Candidatus Dormibacteraeota bacterium]
MIKVAVVDDHPVVRAGITALIKKSGTCRVVGEAGTARAALQLLPAVEPDVVLLDLRLPDNEGCTIVRDLDRCLPRSKLLVLTAYEEVGMAREALRMGARGYLLKGVAGQELLNAIAQVVAGKRIIDPILAGQLWESQVDSGVPTEREIEILRMVAHGHANKEIARSLRISEETVKFHLKNISRRLGARTRTEAVVTATRLGYLDLRS